ncbi:unnamed protein product [Lactuca saligna]|uniref:Uncharacterized protein n=1 Tax=Lactuca saligna TaxID=75948 RepID=A0AA35V4G6_LACSI|nr:unnamed protein product [Lactuca saligna]
MVAAMVSQWDNNSTNTTTIPTELSTRTGDQLASQKRTMATLSAGGNDGISVIGSATTALTMVGAATRNGRPSGWKPLTGATEMSPPTTTEAAETGRKRCSWLCRLYKRWRRLADVEWSRKRGHHGNLGTGHRPVIGVAWSRRRSYYGLTEAVAGTRGKGNKVKMAAA